MFTLKLTFDQYWLVRTALDIYYDEETTCKHFDKSDLDDSLKVADDIIDLINVLKSCAPDPEGGEG